MLTIVTHGELVAEEAKDDGVSQWEEAPKSLHLPVRRYAQARQATVSPELDIQEALDGMVQSRCRRTQRRSEVLLARVQEREATFPLAPRGAADNHVHVLDIASVLELSPPSS
jgi:hypothetical protein